MSSLCIKALHSLLLFLTWRLWESVHTKPHLIPWATCEAGHTGPFAAGGKDITLGSMHQSPWEAQADPLKHCKSLHR